jgi:hypothetical protein
MPNISEEYPLGDWVRDLYDFQRLAGAALPPQARKLMDEFLYARYPDDPRATWKGDRLLAAHLWILRHWRELDLPNVAVVGSSQFAITRHLAAALYRVWLAVPDDKLGGDPDLKWLVTLANEQAGLDV